MGSRFARLAVGGLLLVAVAPISGCVRSLIGSHNVDAMELARDCRIAEAFEQTERSVESGNARQAARGLAIQAALLFDEGRGEEAEALYPEIRIRRNTGLANSEIEAEVRDVLRQIRDAREKTTGSRQC